MTENNWDWLLEVIEFKTVKNCKPLVLKPGTKIIMTGGHTPSNDDCKEKLWNIK